MDVDPKIFNRYMTDRVKLPVRLDEDAKAGEILTARMTDDGMLYARRAEPTDFEIEMIRRMAAGLEVSCEQLTRDYAHPKEGCLTSEEAKRAVETWRRNFADVVNFWATQNGVFADAGPPQKPTTLEFYARHALGGDLAFERVDNGNLKVFVSNESGGYGRTLTPKEIATLKEWL